MSNLITFGCSLTHQVGWADYVSECTGMPLINFSRSAGSNQIQQFRFQELILSRKFDKDDVVIWQITSTHRKNGRIKLNTEWRLKLAKELYMPALENPTTTKLNANLFDGKKRIDFLCVTDHVKNPEDEEQVIENLLFSLVTAKMFFPKLLIVFGWREIIPPQYMKKFKKHLESFNIDYIEEPIVDWCESNKLGFKGSKHPTHRSYQYYAQKIILPKLNTMLGTDYKALEPWVPECTI